MEKGFCLVGLRHHWEDRSLSVSRILLSVCSQKSSGRGIFLQKYIIFTNGIYMGDMDTHRWCVRAGVSPPKRDKTESRSLCVQTSAPGRYRLCPELGGRWVYAMGGPAYKKFHGLWDGISGKCLYTALTILFDPLLQTFTPNEGSSLFLIDALGKHHSWVCVAFPWELPETHGELEEGLDYKVKVRAC